ncbi:MAG: hypothetical protein IE926_02335 [Micrococcales bacterium]|nr:hypothetical protein [Micrococcales bacterium]
MNETTFASAGGIGVVEGPLTVEMHVGRRGRVCVGRLADGADLASAERLGRCARRMRARWLVVDLPPDGAAHEAVRLVAHLRRTATLGGVEIVLVGPHHEDWAVLGCRVFPTASIALGTLGAGWV